MEAILEQTQIDRFELGIHKGVLMLGVAIAFILFFVGLVWLLANPIGWVFIGLSLAALSSLIYSRRKQSTVQRVKAMAEMALELRRLANGFEPIEESYLSRMPGEYVFYERDQVELREYKSAGRATSGGYGGASYRLSKNLSVSGGGIKATSKSLPEESTTIDSGSAIFTNQRVIFMGGNHTREWELSKLLGMEVGDNGFEVSAAVSGRQKTSALAGDCLGMITPGIAFTLAAELFQEGKESAEKLALETAEDIESQIAALEAGKNL